MTADESEDLNRARAALTRQRNAIARRLAEIGYSRQGTGASVPGARGPSTAPVPRAPSLENGAIGNGYPRHQAPPPTRKPTAPSLQPRDKP